MRSPRTLQEMRRLLSPAVRGLQNYVAEAIPCSPTFYAAIAAGLNSVPDEYHDFIHHRGYRVRLGSLLTDTHPPLQGRRPRGYPPGATYAEAPGALLPHPELLVLVAEVVDERQPGGQLRRRPVRNVAGVCREELGHAVDYALDLGHGPASHTDPQFLAAYQAAVAALTDPVVQAYLAYQLQGGHAGREELFAQMFAALFGGGTLGPAYDQAIHQAFPTCLAVLPTLITPP
jgi:hypothetical protein